MPYPSGMSRYGTASDTTQNSVITRVLESADPDDLAAQVNGAIADIYALSPARKVIDISLAGGGDGHTFVVVVEAALATEVSDGGFASAPSVQCYLAGANEALAAARAAARSAGDLSDSQVAGASKGTRFMGMTVRGDISGTVLVLPITQDVGTLDPGSTTVTLTVPQARAGDGVQVNPPPTLNDLVFIVQTHVGVNGEVSMVMFNFDAVPISPGSLTYVVSLFRQ
jgi:hypothetical protein